jgi:hypothetical protein
MHQREGNPLNVQAHAFATAAAGQLRAQPHRATEVDLLWIAARLGLLHRPPRTIVEKVRALAEAAHFPLPKTPRFVKAVRITGPLSIDTRSIWDRDPVEAWLEDDRPPAEGAALVAVRQSAAREEMAKRAAQLTLVSA